MKRSLVSERCFTNYGSLSGIITRLSQIAIAKTTLLGEEIELFRAVAIIRVVKDEWKSNYETVKLRLK